MMIAYLAYCLVVFFLISAASRGITKKSSTLGDITLAVCSFIPVINLVLAWFSIVYFVHLIRKNT